MADPPTDDDGIVQPHDDRETIPNDADLVRYLKSDWLVTKKAPEGSRRLSTMAFTPSSPEYDRYQSMSLDLLPSMLAAGIDPKDKLGDEYEAAVVLRAGDLRDLELSIGMVPVDGNPHHVSVWGVKARHRKRILRLSRWLSRPVDVVDHTIEQAQNGDGRR